MVFLQFLGIELLDFQPTVHGMLRQESFALSCADLGKMGKAFDRWLAFEEPSEKAMLAKAMPPPPAVDTNSSLLRLL